MISFVRRFFLAPLQALGTPFGCLLSSAQNMLFSRSCSLAHSCTGRGLLLLRVLSLPLAVFPTLCPPQPRQVEMACPQTSIVIATRLIATGIDHCRPLLLCKRIICPMYPPFWPSCRSQVTSQRQSRKESGCTVFPPLLRPSRQKALRLAELVLRVDACIC
ncbi:unnamed protein product [Protopolystoma xenopodis]|uniref:Uncharacterized protein n=1 Tax=Protopolystoma xenopodis TaxID=117903 RepID=A0A448X9G1_9PLAT|nr:unnamed protein product [Protopolystoma xenopodis]